MKLKTSTWVLLCLAFGLGSWVYFYEIKQPAKISKTEAQQQQIFNFTEDDIQKLTITKAENILTFVRTENSNQPWQMQQPEDVPASEGTIAFLLDLIATGKSDRRFTTSASSLSQYGLDQSATKITIQLSNQESHEIILGNANFGDRLVYAQVNTAPKTTVILISKNWHYAVERDLSEWKQTP